MDRKEGTEIPIPRRFPRTGGDGPGNRQCQRGHDRLPPHGRGWTSFGGNHSTLGCASPARAGMDRITRSRSNGATSFPRTGGDGPLDTVLELLRAMLPPYGRGWTFSVPAKLHALRASPARAGMDRSCSGRPTACTRFPRTGGDGPVSPRPRSYRLPLPPHGRGWTRDSRACLRTC